MLQATGNINAYKGLIFSLGLTLASSGYVLGHHLPFSSIFSAVKAMTVDLMQELSIPQSPLECMHIKSTASAVQDMKRLRGTCWCKNLTEQVSLEPASLMMLLIKIIGECQDTVLLKRAGSLEKYQYFKQLVASIKEYDLERIAEVTDLCVKNNISFGGSADLLIVTIFLKLLQQTFYVI